MAGIDNAFWTHLVAALLHTLWIGGAAALGLAAALKRIPSRRAELRYGAAAAALAVVVLGWAVSLAVVEYAPAGAQGAPKKDAQGTVKQETGAPAGRSTLPSPATDRAPAAAGIRDAQMGTMTQGRSVERSGERDAASGGSGLLISGLLINGLPGSGWPWAPWLGAAWMAGAGLMLARTARRIAGAGRVRRACRPLADEALGRIVDELRAALGIARRVAVRVGESEYFPCVVGAVWPAVLLPASLLTGVPPEALRAILAHELAHIRRHDYLINLVQMLIESLLFFNPFVWWISRQIRNEREACCDALAAAATGQAGREYARTLVGFAEYRAARRIADAAAPLAAPAFGEARRRGGLIERIRRLAQPDYRPALRLPWHSFVLFLIAAGLILACLKKASDGAVALAAEILTPQQRIEKMAEVQKQYGENNRTYTQADDITLEGQVVTEDGQPLPGRVSMVIDSHRPRSSTGSSASTDGDGTFSIKTSYGVVSIATKADGYAQSWEGPFKTEPGGTIKGIRIVLRRGFQGQIKVVDPQGRPIGGTKFQGYFNTPGGAHSYTWDFDNNPLVADTQGMATVDGASTMSLYLKGMAPGFEETEWKAIQLEPGRAATLTMKPAEPTDGAVVAQKDGYPVPGAKIRLVQEEGGIYNSWSPGHGPVLATADDDGKFIIDTLRKDTKYYAYAEAPGFRREILHPLSGGQRGIRIELGPRLYIKGKVLGEELARKARSAPFLNISQAFQVGDHSNGGNENVHLDVRDGDGVGYFEYDKLWAGKVTISVEGVRKTLNLIEPVTDLVLELQEPAQSVSGATSATREVVFRFDLPAGSPPPVGTLRVDIIEPNKPRNYKPNWLELKGGEARIKVPVWTKVGYSMDTQGNSHDGVTGYWFQEKREIEVPAGTEPFEVRIPAKAAGAIYGQVLEADGTPARGILVSMSEVKKSPEKGDLSFGSIGKSSTSDTDTVNTFNLTPLPLGGTYAVVAFRGQTYMVSEPIAVTEKKPLWQTTLTLPAGVTVRGRVVDEKGKPIAGMRIGFNYSTPYGEGFGSMGPASGEDGGFVFEHVNPDAPGKYSLTADWMGHQKTEVVFKPGEKEVEIRMKKGVTLDGRVIDAETGKPLPGVEVYALARQIEGESDDAYLKHIGYVNAEEKTDNQGAFSFTRLEPGRLYSISCRSGQVEPAVQASGGQKKKVELRVKLDEWVKREREGN